MKKHEIFIYCLIFFSHTVIEWVEILGWFGFLVQWYITLHGLFDAILVEE